MSGELAILNVGDGDTKLSFDKNNRKELERAKRIVTDMLAKGYAILIEVGKDEKTGEPLYRRARAFDPETVEYIIAGDPVSEADIELAVEQTPAEHKAATRARMVKKTRDSRVPADKTRAVAVAPVAGG